MTLRDPARIWAALALMPVALVPAADAARGAYGCWEDFAPADERAGLRSARPTPAAERALVQARHFPGDQHLGRLRWATAHPAGTDVDLGPVKGGVVTVTLPPDRGHGRERPVVRGLRVSDGAAVLERTGTAAPGWTTDTAGAPGILNLTSSDRVSAIDIATGRGLWCAPRSGRFPKEIDNETLVTEHGDVLDIGTSITSLHARTGEPRWRIPVQPETVTTGTGVLADDTDTDPDGLYVHRLSDGTRLWRAPDPNDEIRGVIGVAADRVLVEEGSHDYSWIVALDLGTGRRLWRRPLITSGMQGSRLMDDRLLLGDTFSGDSDVRALKISDGSPIWSARIPGGLDPQYAARHRERLYAPDPSGGLKVLDTVRGTVSRTLRNLHWPPLRYQTDRVASENDVTIGDEILVMQIHNLTLAFDLP